MNQIMQGRPMTMRNEVLHAFSDHSKARRMFEQDSTVPLKEGIDHMAAWAQCQGVRKSQEFDNIEISRNLLLSLQT